MKFRHINQGTCSFAVSFDLEDGIVRNIFFEGGCAGNTQGLAQLAEGMPAETIIERLQGVNCGFKGTSCPDQLARALREALAQMA